MIKMIPLRQQGPEEECHKIFGRGVCLLNELLRQLLLGLARYFGRKRTAIAMFTHPRRVTLGNKNSSMITILQTRLGTTRRSARARMFLQLTQRIARRKTRKIMRIIKVVATLTTMMATREIKTIQILWLRLIRSNLEIETTTSQEH
jgi:hypothetical protein